MAVSYIALLGICAAYIAIYARQGITHPTSIFFLLVMAYLPLKYLMIHFGGFDYSSLANEAGGLSHSGAVELAGLVLLAYLGLTALFHQIFRLARPRMPIFSADIRKSMAGPSIIFAVMIVVLFVIFESVEALGEGLKVRAFTQERGMGYITIVYEIVVLIALAQALHSARYGVLSLLIGIHGAFTILSGRTAPLVSMAMFVVIYLFMVRRHVPLVTILLVVVVLPLAALLHGIVRVRGDIAEGVSYAVDMLAENPDLVQLGVSNLISRIDQLEEFAVLSSAIVSGKVATDPLWPAQLFVQFIPRALWEEKPFFFNGEMMNIFYPEVFQQGITFNFLGVGEFMYAFHLAGVFVAAMVTAFLLYVVDRYAACSRGRIGVFLLFYLVPYSYLQYGFHVGWMNTPALPSVLIALLVLMVLGTVRKLPHPREVGARDNAAGAAT